MNAYEAVNNFRNSFDGIDYEGLVESLKFTFIFWDDCCARECFDDSKLSQDIKEYFMLHDMLAIYHGYWGYLEFENVRKALKGHLDSLLDKPKQDIVDFFVQEYTRQITARANIEQLEAHGVNIIDGGPDEL